ncbi:hypothetical protein LIT32_27125 (plasmid) [Bacillus sp. CMF21]|nr:hypothetical protein LIT32_27125 [Bacillus sp. CMF21]
MKKNMTYVFELNDEKKLNDRVFKVLYHDSKTNIELDTLFMRADTTRGIQWMFIINNADFTQRKDNYIKVVEEAYKGMLPKLQKKFKFKQQKILIDHVILT